MLGQVPKELDSSQRENIFHIRCLINDNLCSLIIDGESCVNVVNQWMRSKEKEMRRRQ